MADHDNVDRDNNGRFMRTLDGAERDAKACEMKSRGATYQQISDTLGYGSRSNAHRAVKAALAAIPIESAEELRRLQLGTLEYLAGHAARVLERQHLTITQSGRIVVDDNGEQVLDDGPILAAIDRILRIQDRKAKLMGLDAPVKTEVITLDYLNARLEELTAELAAEDSAADAG
jgi:hypothetical protein